MVQSPHIKRLNRFGGRAINQVEFEQVATVFATFHQGFAPLFGRTEARERSEQYLRGLLVQQTDRRNAENLAETIDWRHATQLAALSDRIAVG